MPASIVGAACGLNPFVSAVRPKATAFAARLVSTNYLGATTKLALDADGLRLHAIVPAGTALPAEGEAVMLTFNREHLHVMDEPA